MTGAFIHNSIISMIPILLAAMGGLFTELSGFLNIGLEGMILISAFFSVYITSLTSSIAAGITAGIISAVVLAVILAFISMYLKGNLFITGLATNLFASGLTIFLSSIFLNSKGTIVFENIPKLRRLFTLTESDFSWQVKIIGGFNLIEYIALILPFLIFFIIYKTKFGLRLRATGDNQLLAKGAGLSVNKLRLIAFILSGVFSGIAGASLSLPLGAFVGNMSGGRGWMALVAIIIGRRNPIYIMLSAFLLGMAGEFTNVLQTTTEVSPKLLMTLPYLITLFFMIIVPSRKNEKNY